MEIFVQGWATLKDFIIFVDGFMSLLFVVWLFMIAKILFTGTKLRTQLSTWGKRAVVVGIGICLAAIVDLQILLTDDWMETLPHEISRQFTAFLFTVAFYDLVKYLYKKFVKKIKEV